MATELDVSRLVGLIYDAAENPALWSSFLERYGKVLGADLTFIQLHRLEERSSTLTHAWGLNGSVQASYHEHYSRLNLWRNLGWSKFGQGQVVIDEELCSRATLLKSEFYNDFLLPIDGVYSLAAVIARESNKALMLTALRHHGNQQWERADCQPAEMLLPHLARAIAIQERLQLLDAGERVLDALDVGILFLTGAGEVIRGNRPAEQVLESGDGLTVRHGILHATNASADAQLRQAIRTARSAGPSLTCEATVTVPRCSVKRSYQVITAPLHNRPSIFAGMRSPSVVALIIDPDGQRPAASELLIRLYGLTPREAALTSALSSGRTIEQAADDLRMTYETARSHLRHIFEKTDTSRQAELVMLIARLPKAQAKF